MSHNFTDSLHQSFLYLLFWVVNNLPGIRYFITLTCPHRAAICQAKGLFALLQLLAPVSASLLQPDSLVGAGYAGGLRFALICSESTKQWLSWTKCRRAAQHLSKMPAAGSLPYSLVCIARSHWMKVPIVPCGRLVVISGILAGGTLGFRNVMCCFCTFSGPCSDGVVFLFVCFKQGPRSFQHTSCW